MDEDAGPEGHSEDDEAGSSGMLLLQSRAPAVAAALEGAGFGSSAASPMSISPSPYTASSYRPSTSGRQTGQSHCAGSGNTSPCSEFSPGSEFGGDPVQPQPPRLTLAGALMPPPVAVMRAGNAPAPTHVDAAAAALRGNARALAQPALQAALPPLQPASQTVLPPPCDPCASAMPVGSGQQGCGPAAVTGVEDDMMDVSPAPANRSTSLLYSGFCHDMFGVVQASPLILAATPGAEDDENDEEGAAAGPDPAPSSGPGGVLEEEEEYHDAVSETGTRYQDAVSRAGSGPPAGQQWAVVEGLVPSLDKLTIDAEADGSGIGGRQAQPPQPPLTLALNPVLVGSGPLDPVLVGSGDSRAGKPGPGSGEIRVPEQDHITFRNRRKERPFPSTRRELDLGGQELGADVDMEADQQAHTSKGHGSGQRADHGRLVAPYIKPEPGLEDAHWRQQQQQQWVSQSVPWQHRGSHSVSFFGGSLPHDSSSSPCEDPVAGGGCVGGMAGRPTATAAPSRPHVHIKPEPGEGHAGALSGSSGSSSGGGGHFESPDASQAAPGPQVGAATVQRVLGTHRGGLTPLPPGLAVEVNPRCV